MNGWLAYDYIIATEPGQSEFPALNIEIMCRIEMAPCRWWVSITDADALLIVMHDLKGLRPTNQSDLFEFDGDRPDFDDWMAKHHPEISYRWIDQWVIAFADRAAQLSFDDDLGERVLLSAHLPPTA